MFVNGLNWVSQIVFLYVLLTTKLVTSTRDLQPLDNKLYRNLRSVTVDQSNLLFTLKYT